MCENCIDCPSDKQVAYTTYLGETIYINEYSPNSFNGADGHFIDGKLVGTYFLTDKE